MRMKLEPLSKHNRICQSKIGFIKLFNTDSQALSFQSYGRRDWNGQLTNAVELESYSSAARMSHHQSRGPLMLAINASAASSPESIPFPNPRRYSQPMHPPTRYTTAHYTQH